MIILNQKPHKGNIFCFCSIRIYGFQAKTATCHAKFPFLSINYPDMHLIPPYLVANLSGLIFCDSKIFLQSSSALTLPLCLCHVNYPIILHMTRLFYVEIFIIIFIFCVQLLRENSSPDIWAIPEEGVSFPLMTASPHEVVTLFNVLGIPAYSHAKKPSGWEIRVGGFCGTKDLGFGFPFLPQ